MNIKLTNHKTIELFLRHDNCSLKLQEAEMTTLKSCEILDELKKLGIDRPSDILEYLSEYTDYCSRKNCNCRVDREEK